MVECVAALPDGAHFVVGLAGNGRPDYADEHENEVRLYHVDGTLVHTFEGHTGWVHAVAVTPDGQRIISGSQDTRVMVWSVATKSLVSTCAGHTEWVLAVAAMPDGQRFLSGGGMSQCGSSTEDYAVLVWLLDGTLKNTFSELHTSEVTALAALPDNEHALSGSADKTVKLFNANDGAVLRTFTHHTYDHRGVTSLALLPDGLRFVSSGFLDDRDDNEDEYYTPGCATRIAYH
jgi:WD40 repeat protein